MLNIKSRERFFKKYGDKVFCKLEKWNWKVVDEKEWIIIMNIGRCIWRFIIYILI